MTILYLTKRTKELMFLSKYLILMFFTGHSSYTFTRVQSLSFIIRFLTVHVPTWKSFQVISCTGILTSETSYYVVNIFMEINVVICVCKIQVLSSVDYKFVSRMAI